MTRSSRPPAAPATAGLVPPRALPELAHPLPAGMRDLLPNEARAQTLLGRRLLASFELFGYRPVGLPVFEYADVLERGLGALEPGRVLRFVEPETGEVVALRPDMTPQIARLVATRLADAPGPARLCYEGSVLRRRAERARLSRQIPQAGCELVGGTAAEGDLEVLSVASAAVRAAGLGEFVLDLGHARIVASLLAGVARADWPPLIEALAVKDAAALAQRARGTGLEARTSDALASLASLAGDFGMWERAVPALAGTAAQAPAEELRALHAAALSAGLAPTITADLGETWNFEYYTGAMFQILARGPGAAVASGGRYDGLLERFAAPRPSAGFAIDLDHLAWALRVAGVQHDAPSSVVCRARSDDTRRICSGLARELRRCGVSAVESTAGDAREYARAWGHSHVADVGSQSVSLARVDDGASVTLDGVDPVALADAVRSALVEV